MSEVAVLSALELLTDQMNQRFDTADDKVNGINHRLDVLNGRVKVTEKALTNFKAVITAAGAVLVWFGWDGMKLWLTTLTK